MEPTTALLFLLLIILSSSCPTSCVERLASIQVERSDKTFKPARVGLNVVSLVFVKIIFSQIQDTADQHLAGVGTLANNESSEVSGIIKPGQRVKLNRSQAVNQAGHRRG